MSSAVVSDDDRGLRAVYLAMASAILFTQVLVSLGLIDIDKSSYRSATLHWVEAVLSGSLFWCGMVRDNGCGLRSLVSLRRWLRRTCLHDAQSHRHGGKDQH